MQNLETLSTTDEGKNVAGCLQYKHWRNLPLESMIHNLFLIKSRLEYVQSFYVINEIGITADEAYRFLNNRWMQCQIQSRKKVELFIKQTSQSGVQRTDGKQKKRKVKENKNLTE